MSGTDTAKEKNCNKNKDHTNELQTVETPKIHGTYTCCSAIDVANHFIQSSKIDKDMNLTPLLIEKMVVLAHAYCFEQGQFNLADEEISQDQYGEYFRSLRNYLGFYSHDTVITKCFSNLSPEDDFLAKTKLGAEYSYTKLESYSSYLDVIYDYVKTHKLDWSDLSEGMKLHLNNLITDRGRRVNG